MSAFFVLADQGDEGVTVAVTPEVHATVADMANAFVWIPAPGGLRWVACMGGCHRLVARRPNVVATVCGSCHP